MIALFILAFLCLILVWSLLEPYYLSVERHRVVIQTRGVRGMQKHLSRPYLPFLW